MKTLLAIALLLTGCAALDTTGEQESALVGGSGGLGGQGGYAGQHELGGSGGTGQPDYDGVWLCTGLNDISPPISLMVCGTIIHAGDACEDYTGKLGYACDAVGDDPMLFECGGQAWECVRYADGLGPCGDVFCL